MEAPGGEVGMSVQGDPLALTRLAGF